MATSNRDRAHLTPNISNTSEFRRVFTNWMHQANRGGLVATGQVTLGAGATTTTVEDARTGPVSCIGFMPTTVNAAIEKPNLIVATQGNGFFVITHTNTTDTDRTYTYCIMG